WISGPDGTGTGYLLAPGRIGTAHHVVKSWGSELHDVVVGVGGPKRKARLLKSDPQADAAVLAIGEPVDAEPLPIAGGLARKVAWEGYGYPALAAKGVGPVGLPIDGHVQDAATTNDIGQPSILLYSNQAAAGEASPLHGFSGCPVLVDGALVGH